MDDCGYKSELEAVETSVNRSQTPSNDIEFEEKSFLNEIIIFFQQENDLASINESINELSKAVFFSKESASFMSSFIESDILGYLFDFIRSNSLKNSTKIEIIKIINNVIDHLSIEDAVRISNLDIIEIVFKLMQLYFPESVEDRETIDCLQTILNFLTKLSSINIESRDSILQKYPYSAENILTPFSQLFEMIKFFSNIKTLQLSYICFFSSLCRFKLDYEAIKVIYNEYVIGMFDKSIVEEYDTWEYILPIFRYFIYNGYGKIVGERDQTYQILIEAISNGNSKAAKTSLIIMGMLIDKNFDVFSCLDIPYLCEKITDIDVKISNGIMNLIEVLINPATVDSEKEDQSQSESSYQKDDDDKSTGFFNDPLIFLFKNNLLSQLKKILINGCFKQKISSLKVLMAIYRRKQTAFTLKDISEKIIKENLITPLVDIFEIDEVAVSMIVCDIFVLIFQNCVNDNQVISNILLQINECDENFLLELDRKLKETDDELFQNNLQFIINEISEYNKKEEIISLIYSFQNENDETGARNFQNDDDDDDENNESPFNQGSRKRGGIKSVTTSIL